MCGISGFISFGVVNAEDFVRMNNIIRHRGPDDEGFVSFSGESIQVCGGKNTPREAWESNLPYAPKTEKLEKMGSVSLAHRRLAIVDVSPAGHQPMCTPDKRTWIVYNGEVYNHIELRAELEGLGHAFFSHSDTEVILAAYRQWGKECLSRFNGMFAFLIYDRENHTLFAARDRFGVKPLYYWISENGIAFASEIKQFTLLPGWLAVMNGQRVYDFLNWGVTDHTDETLYSKVFQLRGGEMLTIDANISWEAGGRLPVHAWYTLETKPFKGTFQEAAIEFRHLLTNSVRLRLRADVPVGSCLSGGLDSSSIVCIVNELLREQGAQHLQKTFSACADVEKFDEKKWIDIVVASTGVDAHYVYPPLSNLFTDSEAITWHQDEPFGSSSIYAQWNVFRIAGENGVKVMLDGQGADEQLAGYHTFFAARFARLFREFRWHELWLEMASAKRIHGYSCLLSARWIATALLPEWLLDLRRKIAGVSATRLEWINMDILGAKPENPYLFPRGSSIEALSRAQLTATNLQMLLHWEDRDSMAYSIESRVPFLDYRLVEFALGLPDEYKLSLGMTKRILREGMDGILPIEIRDRIDKLGFVTPEESWVKASAGTFRKKLEEAVSASRGVLNEKVLDIFDEMVDGRRPFSFFIWRMISFGHWASRFEVMARTGSIS